MHNTYDSKRFAIEYPDNLDVTFPNNERDHINIKKWENNFISEEFSIGNSTVTYNKKSLALGLLEDLTEDFNLAYSDVYNIIVILPLPQEKKDMNAVLVTFLTGESSESQSINEDENLGIIRKAWDTFRYVE